MSRNRVLRNPVVNTFNDLRDSVWDIWRYVFPQVIVITADYTLDGKAGWTIVVCNNTSAITVTLHAGPEDQQRVTIKRKNTGGVTVATADENTIDGGSTLSVGAQYDAPLMMFTEDGGEWSLI